ncbi:MULTISPECIES: FxsA family protein [unclassified Aureimonas]|uniref:FxsA family protein n=1 Tax=unclassified Aureimonas TaxID=2615206 RepID=UPI0006FCF5AF|nr:MULTISPECIES: FxsA family protein [unclassified Aureimonas]KQT52576.1 hypothetical protein ASG62_15335 [Aureimonas sp. Leaf427]KQT77523.1 hypothetical protein ASG54_11075 [Aureimonas sp. Leaf460]
MPIIPVLLLGAPILEIAVLILVGEQIGLLPTLGIVVGSALVGAILLKRQGFAALARIRAETAAGRVPGRDIVHGVMIVLAGILLLLPGLIGDVIGVLLFLPPVRDLLWRALGRSVTVVATTPMGFQRFGRGMPGAGPRTPQPGVLDLDDEDFHRRGDPNGRAGSPWSGEGDEPGKRTLH